MTALLARLADAAMVAEEVEDTHCQLRQLRHSVVDCTQRAGAGDPEGSLAYFVTRAGQR